MLIKGECLSHAIPFHFPRSEKIAIFLAVT